MSENDPFQQRMQRLESLLREVEAIPDFGQRDRTSEIIQGLMAFYGAGLEAIAHHLERAGDAGEAILADLSQDELVGGLFALHDLHPRPLQARVEAALETVRPYLGSHGGNIQLLEVSEQGVVRLMMQGSCHGCPSSTLTMKNAVEKAIYEHAPEVSAIELSEPPKPDASTERTTAGFVPLDQVVRRITRPPLQGAVT